MKAAWRWIGGFGAMLLAGMAISAAIDDSGGRASLEHPATRADAVVALPPKLRATLIAEMVGLKQGVADLAGSLSTGEWSSAAKTAGAIRDSYILRQALSASDLRELESILPPAFAELDAQLHEHADALADAAEQHNAELTVFYYGKLLDGCQSCHRRYAIHTLPGFAVPELSNSARHTHGGTLEP